MSVLRLISPSDLFFDCQGSNTALLLEAVSALAEPLRTVWTNIFFLKKTVIPILIHERVNVNPLYRPIHSFLSLSFTFLTVSLLSP